MDFVLQPWQLLLVILAGWVNQQQQQVIDYLRTENQVPREKLGRKRILLDDDQRRRLAVKCKVLGRKVLEQLGTLFTPDTILRWHRMLVAQKWDYSDRRKTVGRPPVVKEIVDLVLRMARENPTWGYDKIQGALANLGHEISDATVGNILKAHGIEPAPERKRQTTWKTFLKAHWDVLSAIAFTTIEVRTKGGLVTFYLLLAIKLSTRRVAFAGCTPNPHDAWMKQVARNRTDPFDGSLGRGTYLLMDRDGKYSESFHQTLIDAEVIALRLPPRSPNLNAYAERIVRSLQEACLDRMIFLGERSLRTAVSEFLSHYHAERNHQGLRNQVIDLQDEVGRATEEICCRQRLGGMLRYYYRRAA